VERSGKIREMGDKVGGEEKRGGEKEGAREAQAFMLETDNLLISCSCSYHFFHVPIYSAPQPVMPGVEVPVRTPRLEKPVWKPS
jgi:hypothetical protein